MNVPLARYAERSIMLWLRGQQEYEEDAHLSVSLGRS